MFIGCRHVRKILSDSRTMGSVKKQAVDHHIAFTHQMRMSIIASASPPTVHANRPPRLRRRMCGEGSAPQSALSQSIGAPPPFILSIHLALNPLNLLGLASTSPIELRLPSFIF